ncbi:alpha/beta fold hydrolase [Paenibacillus thailandensis]|uniref:Alpha/beta fold hydrolase n=1 Tax=Paenibacillus thailandensis TaxID=393250 RepID=A0ABW5QVB8_9BACL
MSAISLSNRSMTLNNGVTIAYYDSEPEPQPGVRKPVAVLLHGYCGSSAYWERVVPLLAGGIRIIAPDLRGHGLSGTAEEEGGTIEMYAQDAAEMIERLDIGKAYLLGHSLGGYIALAVAELYAGKLAGFGLIHSTPLPDSEEAKAGRDKAVATIRGQGVSAFVEGLVPKLFAPSVRSERADDLERALAIGRGTSGLGAVQAAIAMRSRPDRTGTLTRLDMPVLLVAGKQDGVVPPEKTFMSEGPGVTPVMLDNAGHMGMYEEPDKLAEAVLSFAGAKKD